MSNLYKKVGISVLTMAVLLWASAPASAQHHEKDEKKGAHQEKSEMKGEHNEGGHETDMETSASAEEIVAEILSRDLMIQHLIESGELTKIHKPAFEAKDLVASLLELSHGDDNPSMSKKILAASKRISASAKLLDKYGDAEDSSKTASAYKTFGAAIKQIEDLYSDVRPENYWTCSMHPDVRRGGSGMCPKCDMKLIEKGESGHGEHRENNVSHDKHKGGH